MQADRFLIIGGTGKTGRKVAEALTRRDKAVRIGSRGGEPPFEWNNRATWAATLDGISAVYITYQPDLAVPGASEAIEQFSALAVEKGVRKLVLLSGKGETEAERCEQLVMNSGADWTIVRASWFNQNFSESFFLDPILAGQVALPRAEARIPFVDTDDIAAVVVAALLDDKHNGQIYEVTGPRQLTFQQAVDEIARASGREIAFQPITLEAYEQMLREFQVPEDYIWLIKYLFTEVLVEKNSAVSDDVRKVLGRPAKDFSDFARETARSGVWNPAQSPGIPRQPKKA